MDKTGRSYLDRSKYSYIKEEKLHDLYLTQFLREIWSVPANQISEYFKKFYPNPTALELIEIRQLISLVTKVTKNSEDGTPLQLTEEEQRLLQYRHNRMFGKERQVIELSGLNGGPIMLKDMSDDELDRTITQKLGGIAKAIKKSKNE